MATTSPWEGNWQVEYCVSNLELAPDTPGNTFTTCAASSDSGGPVLTEGDGGSATTNDHPGH